jgi:hypothetical protein
MSEIKLFAIPFQRGYRKPPGPATPVFTDYLWNDGTTSRVWHDPEIEVKRGAIVILPFSLQPPFLTNED